MIREYSANRSEHFKSYKSGKIWVFAGITSLTMAAGLVFSVPRTVKADSSNTVTTTSNAPTISSGSSVQSDSSAVLISSSAATASSASISGSSTASSTTNVNSESSSTTSVSAKSAALITSDSASSAGSNSISATSASSNSEPVSESTSSDSSEASAAGEELSISASATSDTSAASQTNTVNLGVANSSNIESAKSAASSAYASTGVAQTITASLASSVTTAAVYDDSEPVDSNATGYKLSVVPTGVNSNSAVTTDSAGNPSVYVDEAYTYAVSETGSFDAGDVLTITSPANAGLTVTSETTDSTGSLYTTSVSGSSDTGMTVTFTFLQATSVTLTVYYSYGDNTKATAYLNANQYNYSTFVSTLTRNGTTSAIGTQTVRIDKTAAVSSNVSVTLDNYGSTVTPGITDSTGNVVNDITVSYTWNDGGSEGLWGSIITAMNDASTGVGSQSIYYSAGSSVTITYGSQLQIASITLPTSSVFSEYFEVTQTGTNTITITALQDFSLYAISQLAVLNTAAGAITVELAPADGVSATSLTSGADITDTTYSYNVVINGQSIVASGTDDKASSYYFAGESYSTINSITLNGYTPNQSPQRYINYLNESDETGVIAQIGLADDSNFRHTGTYVADISLNSSTTIGFRGIYVNLSSTSGINTSDAEIVFTTASGVTTTMAYTGAAWYDVANLDSSDPVTDIKIEATATDSTPLDSVSSVQYSKVTPSIYDFSDENDTYTFNVTSYVLDGEGNQEGVYSRSSSNTVSTTPLISLVSSYSTNNSGTINAGASLKSSTNQFVNWYSSGSASSATVFFSSNIPSTADTFDGQNPVTVFIEAPTGSSFESDAKLDAYFSTIGSDVTITHLADTDGRQVIEVSGLSKYLSQNIDITGILVANADDLPGTVITANDGLLYVDPASFISGTLVSTGDAATDWTEGNVYKITTSGTLATIIAPSVFTASITAQGSGDTSAQSTTAHINLSDDNSATVKSVAYNGTGSVENNGEVIVTVPAGLSLAGDVEVVDENGNDITSEASINITTDSSGATIIEVSGISLSAQSAYVVEVPVSISDTTVDSGTTYTVSSESYSDTTSTSTPLTNSVEIEAERNVTNTYSYVTGDGDGNYTVDEEAGTQTGISGDTFDASSEYGAVGSTVNNKYVIVGYYDATTGETISDPSSITYSNSGTGIGDDIYIIETHATSVVTDAVTTTGTVSYTGAGDETPSAASTTLEWNEIVDNVTGKVLEYEIDTDNSNASIASPDVTGYTPSESEVTFSTSDTTTTPVNQTATVNYSPNAQSTTYQFVDNDNGGTVVTDKSGNTSETISGVTNESVNYDVTSEIPTGYELAAGQTATGTVAFSATGAATITINLVHQHTITANAVTTTNTVNYSGAGAATPAASVANVDWTSNLDDVTGIATYTADNETTTIDTTPVAGYSASATQTTFTNSTTTSNPTDQSATVTYTPDAQSTYYQFVDDDNNGEVVDDVSGNANESISGVTDETVDYDASSEIPSGYELASGQSATGSVTFTSDGAAVVTIHLVHKINTSTPYATYSVDVDNNSTGAQLANSTNTYQIDYSTDEVTGEQTLNSETGDDTSVTVPDGYSVDNLTIKSSASGDTITLTAAEVAAYEAEGIITVSGNTYTFNMKNLVASETTSSSLTDSEDVINSHYGLILTINASADAQSTTYQFVDEDDNGSVVKDESGNDSETISGVTDETVNYDATNEIPAGYELAPGQSASGTVTFGANGAAVVSIKLVHVHETGTLTTSDTVNYIGLPDDKSQPSQSNSIVYNTDTDEATGVTTYTPENLTDVSISSPTVAGYTADQLSVDFGTPSVTTTLPTDRNKTVTYSANPQTVTIEYLDDDSNGAVVSSSEIDGVTDGSVDWSANVPTGYELAENQVANGTYTFTSNGNQVIEVHLVHAHKVGTLTVTDTVSYTGLPDSKSQSNQSIDTTYTTDTDEVTGITTYTPNNNDDVIITTPVVAGYLADQTSVNFGTPNTTTIKPSDRSTTVTYSALTDTVTINYIDTQTGQKVGSTQVSGKTDEIVVIPNLSGFRISSNAIYYYDPETKQINVYVEPVGNESNGESSVSSNSGSGHNTGETSGNQTTNGASESPKNQTAASTNSFSNNNADSNQQNQKADKLPQTGDNQQESQLMGIIGVISLSVLGMFGLGKPRKRRTK